MKTLEEFIKEIDGSEELQEELKNATDADAANAFLKKHGCAATAGELAEYIKSQRQPGKRELSDDEVSDAAGGVWMNFGFGWTWVDEEIPHIKSRFEQQVVQPLPDSPIIVLPEDDATI